MARRRYRTVVCGHDQKFFYPLQRSLEATNWFEFREDHWPGHDIHDERKSRELLDWAEIIICEWTLGNAVWYSRHKQPHQHLVTRFHLQERMTPHPAQLALDAVHRVIFVGPHIEREANERLGIPPDKTCVINNLVDVERFDRPKYEGAFFNLGMIGVAPRRKRMDLAIGLLEQLKQRDDRYTLHIKGAHPTDYDWLWARTAERHYYVRQWERINASPLRNSIIFDPQADDVPDWFRCIGFVLSPSDFESFHMAISEGMASGTLPVIRDWDGAEEIHPEEYVVSTIEQAADLVETLRTASDLEDRRAAARDYVRQHFDRNVIRDQWIEMLLPERAGRPRRPEQERPEDGESALRQATKERMLVVVYAIDNWSSFHRREMLEALAAQTTEDADFLIIEPGSHYSTIAENAWATQGELRAFTRGQPVRLGENIWTHRFITGGLPADVTPPEDLTWGLDEPSLRRDRIRRMFPDHRKVLYWLYKPDLRERWLDPRDRYVYECYDEYTRDFASGKRLPDVERLERATLAHAEAAFFTSRPLFDAKGQGGPSPVLAENGVAYAEFARHREAGCRFDGPARVGYLGNLSDFFDWDVMLHLATELPEVTFDLLGPIDPKARLSKSDMITELEQMPNCRFTGRVGRAQGAKAIAQCHALVIPFVCNLAMEAVNPLKLWEYFAVGRPVVSSPIQAISQLDDLIYFADSPAKWVEQVRAAVEEDNETLRNERITLAENHAWSTLTAKHAAVLRDLKRRL